MAKTGNFVKKVQIIPDEEERLAREGKTSASRNRLEPPSIDDDDFYDFLNGNLMSTISEVAGGDDEFMEIDLLMMRN